MGLDYSNGCVNFRDIGESLELITGTSIFPKNKLFRGGKIDFVKHATTIQNPATILNLRRGQDPQCLPTIYAHFPASNDLEKYETSNRKVRRWLNDVVSYLSKPDTQFPLLIHCTSGKDRTGVVVAAILMIVGIDRTTIIEEYLLSEGEVHPRWIEMALDGIADPKKYFHRVDLQALVHRLAK
ncbi:tyrosine-protein phosphatase [Pseudanabaena sp. UWO310]|nr:tyrosine-protein phosphatase [Pseudanabaena sp. UWO310]